MTGREATERVYRDFVKTRFPLPTVWRLDDFEAKHNMILPRLYREFLLGFNGGSYRPCPNVWAPSLNQGIALNSLFGFDAPYSSAELENNVGIFDEGPDQILVIGNAPGNHLFLLVTDLSDADYGSVLYRTFVESHYLCKDILELFVLTEPNIKYDAINDKLLEPLD